jgi:hypothetical protein
MRQEPAGTELHVPGEVVAAIITGRPELLLFLRKRLAAGDALDNLQAQALVDLVERGIREQQQDLEAFEALLQEVSQVRGTMAGMGRKLDALQDRARELRDGVGS